jgi:hypothetical protein
MARPSNRELKVLSAVLDGGTTSADDFKDIGEKTFEGLAKKGWIVAAEGQPAGTYQITEQGTLAHEQELFYGRWKR